MLGEAAGLQIDYTFPLQNAMSRADMTRQLLQIDNVEARRDSVHKKRDFYCNDANNFKLWRRNIAVGMMQAKYDAMADPNGPLAYEERLTALKERQQADVEAAYGRMLAIHQGLKTVYNIDLGNLPSVDPLSLEKCVNWLRKVDNALAQISRLDQQYVLRISLKNSVDNFGGALAPGGSGSWKIHLSTARFDGQRLLRIRGVALYAVDNTGDSFYDVDVTVPGDDAKFVYGTPEPPAPCRKAVPDSSLNQAQTNISKCWFRGVGSRQKIRPPEITGGDALYNCTPIGTWTVNLVGDSTIEAATRNGLQDLQLDIHLATQKAG
jgi:hypothetical protein